MEKKLGAVGKFFDEFKKFIMRGNVLDMSVGVIVGGAFTGIVNGLSNYILKPLINWLLALIIGKDGLTGAITMLSGVKQDVLDANGAVIGWEWDLVNSIYIDWGAFISSIINFLIIAIVLFSIVKIMNSINEAREDAEEEFENTRKAIKEIKRIKKEQKISFQKAQELYKQQVETKKAEIAAANALAAEKAAEEARLAEEKANANTLLLQEILQVLKNK